MSLEIIILAAGKGSRMNTALPKVLLPIGGIPMLQRVVHTARMLQPKNIHVVYGNGGSCVKDHLSFLPVNWVEQIKPQGTGHAVMCALPHCEKNSRILVLYGDVPLLKVEVLQSLLDVQQRLHGLSLLTAVVEDPAGFGRIVRDEKKAVQGIVEHRDADIPTRAIREINTGILCSEASHFAHWLPQLNKGNKQKEYYLTDVVAIAVADGVKVETVQSVRPEEALGANALIQLAALERYFQQEQAEQWCQQGVRIVDPSRFDVRGDACQIAADVVIEPNVIIEGEVSIGARTRIESHVILRDCQLGEDCIVKSHSVVEGAIIANYTQIGPFARLREGTRLAEHVKVGNFVELKKTQMGEGSKASHLTYLGDACIGQAVNIGAGTITCNYDGKHKSTTVIEDHAFIGANTALVAPIHIGAKATVGAGSTLSQDVPGDALTFNRAKVRTIIAWHAPRFIEND